LFLPISFYFNTIPINYNSENNLHVKMSIVIHPDENYTRWHVYIFDLFLESNSEPLIIEDIDWGEVNRNGNINKTVGNILTNNLSYIKESLKLD
jgi:hypothetical protein